MKSAGRIAIAVCAGALALVPAVGRAQYGNGYGQPGYGRPGYNQGDRGWDAPPNDYRQALQQDAFRAGLDGARRDLENRRQPNVNNRDEFRNYRGPNRRAYREAFQRGYSAFWAHQGGGNFRPGGRPRY